MTSPCSLVGAKGSTWLWAPAEGHTTDPAVGMQLSRGCVNHNKIFRTNLLACFFAEGVCVEVNDVVNFRSRWRVGRDAGSLLLSRIRSNCHPRPMRVEYTVNIASRDARPVDDVVKVVQPPLLDLDPSPLGIRAPSSKHSTPNGRPFMHPGQGRCICGTVRRLHAGVLHISTAQQSPRGTRQPTPPHAATSAKGGGF